MGAESKAGRRMSARDLDLSGEQFRGMARIPGGEFAMGSAAFYPEERPVRRISTCCRTDRKDPHTNPIPVEVK